MIPRINENNSQLEPKMYKNLFRTELLDEKFRKAIGLFNDNHLHLAYELLFDLWYESKSPNRKLFYQGVLQACATLYLIQDGKFCGAQKTLYKSLKNLAPFAKLTKPFNIQQLMKDIYNYSSTAILLASCDGDMDVPVKTRPRISTYI